ATCGAKEVHRVDAEAAVLGSFLQRRRHRQVLECLDDLPRALVLEARCERAVRQQILLRRIEVDDQEDSAEELEELAELVEHLLEEEVVGLDRSEEHTSELQSREN